jgi:hypothetical protein
VLDDDALKRKKKSSKVQRRERKKNGRKKGRVGPRFIEMKIGANGAWENIRPDKRWAEMRMFSSSELHQKKQEA